MSDEPTAASVESVAPQSPVSAPSTGKKDRPRSPAASYVWGTGRRKTAVARVRIKSGDGKFLVNERKLEEFFRLDKDRASVRQPLKVTDSAKSYDVFVNVIGGGTSGQAGAVMLGLARALRNANPDYEPKLREHRLLSRDPRKVERKKYGRSGARKSYQFSKR